MRSPSRRLSFIAQRLHSRHTKVKKHSAPTAGQLPSGTGREFPVDQRRIFGTRNRETSPTCSSTASPSIGSSLSKYHPSQTVQKSGEVSQCQHLDRYRRARRVAETGPDQPDNPEDVREDTGPSAQRHVPIIQKIQKIAETPQVVQRECRSSRRSRRNSCGRCRGSSSCRRRLSTRQVLVIQSPEDRVCQDMIVDFLLCVTTPSTDNPDDAADNGGFSEPAACSQRTCPRWDRDRTRPRKSRRLSPRHKDRSQRHLLFTQNTQKFAEVPRVVQRLSRSP